MKMLIVIAEQVTEVKSNVNTGTIHESLNGALPLTEPMSTIKISGVG